MFDNQQPEWNTSIQRIIVVFWPLMELTFYNKDFGDMTGEF